MEITLGQQYNVGVKPAVILYININLVSIFITLYSVKVSVDRFYQMSKQLVRTCPPTDSVVFRTCRLVVLSSID